jgi:hypothetical protein
MEAFMVKFGEYFSHYIAEQWNGKVEVRTLQSFGKTTFLSLFIHHRLSGIVRNHTFTECTAKIFWCVFERQFDGINSVATYRLLLTLILLTWRIWWAPHTASKCQMGFNSTFKGLNWWKWMLQYKPKPGYFSAGSWWQISFLQQSLSLGLRRSNFWNYKDRGQQMNLNSVRLILYWMIF